MLDEFDHAALKMARDSIELVFARHRGDHEGANRNVKQMRASANRMAEQAEREAAAART